MITITCVKKPSVEHILLTGKNYSVGRKGCDLTFSDDHSVSRNHASINVDHPIANISNGALTPSVVVTDLGSKFGTFVNDGIENNQQVAMREPNTLSNGDRFRFGLQWNEFKIKYTPLITTSSGTIKDLPSLRNTMCQIGAHLLVDWKDGCDYLITESLQLTVKAVCALLSAKHIVTPKFFHDYLDAINSKTKLPNPADYLPPVVEKLPQPHSFEPNLARTKLFESKIFLFSTAKQAKKISVAIRCAGGATDIISSISPSLLKSENTLIVASANEISLMDAATRQKVEMYQSCKKRTIPESEIGLAAIYASIDRHCNPFFNITQQVFPKTLISQTQHSASPSSSVVIVPETQPSLTETQKSTIFSQSQQSRNIVEETFVSSQPSSTVFNPPILSSARVVSLSQSQSQPMEFAVPTPRIKEEVVDESEFRATTRSTRNNTGTIRKGDESVGADGSSGNKRRREATTSLIADSDTQIAGPSRSRREPSPKRLRSETMIDDKAARYTTDSSKTLSSIFGMSDDDDEDEPEPEPVPEPPVRTTRSTRSAGTSVVKPQPPPAQIVEVIPETPEVHDIADDAEQRSSRSRSRSSRSESKSPVKQESVARQTPTDPENSKRKQPVDKDHEEELSTSKKRRIEKVTTEIKRSTSIDGFTTVPGLHDTTKKIQLRSSEKLNEHIPEENIKPLSFTFAPLIKRVPIPAIQQPAENDGTGRSAFNFKAFRKVLPLCLNSSIGNSRTGSNPVVTTRTRTASKIKLRPYNSLGFEDSEPYVASNRMSVGMGRPETPDKGNTNTNKSRIADSDEPMDDCVSVVDISPASSTTSNTTLRRSGRNARGATTADVQNTGTSSASVNSPSKRGTRSTGKIEDSPPSFFEEEDAPDPPDNDDEWAF